MKKLWLLLVVLSLVLVTGCNRTGAGAGDATDEIPEDPPFEENEVFVTVTYMAEIGGEIRGETDQIVFRGENAAPVTAVADEGWVFAGWDDGCATATRADHNVTSDAVYTARFVRSTDADGGIDLPDVPF